MTEIPKIRPPHFNTIPQELKDVPNWVNWKYFWIEDKQRWTKLPLNPIGLKAAKSDDPATWGTFATVCGNLYNCPELGIGFQLGNTDRPTGYMCIDLDHVLTDGQITNPDAKDIFETLDSYTEITPGGDGLHIWIKAAVTEDRRKRKGVIEIYRTGRYMTVTGEKFGNRDTIEERTAEINEIIEKYLTDPAADQQQTQGAAGTFPSVGTSTAAPYDPWDALEWDSEISDDGNGWNGRTDPDDVIIRKMTAKPDAARLWNGDMSAHNNDHSAADQALTNHLAYWTNYDAETVDRLFRQSGLMRPKWDEIHSQGKTYGQMTIENALKGHTPRMTAVTAAPNQQQQTQTAAGTFPSVGTNQQSTQGTTQGTGSQKKENQDYLEDVHNYSAGYYESEFEQMIHAGKTPRISTGFPYLNQLLDGGLYPSLITLGAVTSTGKTTLGLQIVDNIAAAGTDVIIFSLEMSRFELIAKSISRLTFKRAVDKSDAVTTRQLMNWGDYSNYSVDRQHLIGESKLEYFSSIAPHVFIREALGDMNVLRIRDILRAHEDQTGAAPVVLVDYIQLLGRPFKSSMTDKQIIDYNIMALKQISRDFNTPVIAISSLNRQAYATRGSQPRKGEKRDTRVHLEDFKESGAIEYSSDILLGLSQESYDYQTKTGQMIVDILKNRNGEKGTAQAFDYYYKYNCFIDANRSIGNLDWDATIQ